MNALRLAVLAGILGGLPACSTPGGTNAKQDPPGALLDSSASHVASPYGQGPFLVRGVGVEYQPTYVERHRGWVLLKWFDARSNRYVRNVWMPETAVVSIEPLGGR